MTNDMNQANPPRIMIAGSGSGCGKTTVTCAVLGAFKERGIAVSSFKCGPDYIDPMFHSEIIGANARNLDLFLMKKQGTLYSLATNSLNSRLSVIEGVMGFYDGVGSTADYSSWALSNDTKTPVLVVLNCKGMSLTVCALLQGLRDFKPNRISGVILNQVKSPQMAEYYQKMIEAHTGLRVYGYLPPMPEVSLESRHLGLVTAAEVSRLQEMIHVLAVQAEKTLDLDGLMKLAGTAEPFSYNEISIRFQTRVRIGIAKDKAFCFYYRDGLDLLIRMGAELVEFSPLTDKELPDGISGVIFGGGYPELYLKQLSGNFEMLESIRSAWKDGMPVYGECGGFIYLQERFIGRDGTAYSLVGLINSASKMTDRLQRFGYVTLTAQTDNLLCKKEDQISAHEFHYADSERCGDAFLAKKESSGVTYPCVVTQDHLVAGYPHLHFYASPDFAERLLRACAAYQEKRGQKRL